MKDKKEENALEIINLEEKHQVELSSESPAVCRGDVYASDTGNWRVIDIRQKGIMVINLENSAIQLKEHLEFFELLEQGQFVKVRPEPQVHINLSPEEVAELKRKARVLEGLLENTYPEWGMFFTKHIGKNLYKEAINDSGLTRKSLRKMLLTYLLSGREPYSLADKRKLNRRPNLKGVVNLDNPRQNTDMLYRFLLTEFKKTQSVRAAHDNMVRTYFRDPVIEDGIAKMVAVPEEEISISYKQAHRYIENHLGGLTITQYKNGMRNTMNNDRLLPGDAKYGVTRLGQIYEADECELPCYIKDAETNEVVGKAIVYVLAEVKSSSIVGAYISYDNNSNIGIRQALLSMMEPHQNQTERYNLVYTEDEFPSMTMPEEIRCDHGAEYESKNFNKAMGELGITVSLVPVACGSFKGLVESINSQIQIHLKNHARNAGAVTKQYRGGDIAKGNASLTLEDLREIVYKAILYINRRVIEGYLPTLEQAKAEIAFTPASIYAYEKQRSGDPKNVTEENRDRLMYMLLAKADDKRSFNIGREGIVYKRQLFFFSEEMWFKDMLLDEKDLKSIEVRYDETNIGCVYICYRNVVHKVPLSAKRQNQLTYRGISWDMFDELIKNARKSKAQTLAKVDGYNKKLDIIDTIEQKENIDKALNGSGRKYGKAKKEDRALAREKTRKDGNEIINRMYAEVDEKVETKKSADLPKEPVISEIEEISPLPKTQKELEREALIRKHGPNAIPLEDEIQEMIDLLKFD